MGKATILIVENDAILAMDLQVTISQQGYSVVGPFASGEEAIAFLPGKQVDLVLMDIELAGEINGIGTAEIIHSTTDIPIVFLSSFSQDGLLAQAKTAAPYGYLIKPVSERELVTTLEMSLHRYSLDRQLKESQIALAKSEEKYRQLFENSPLGIFRTTLDGRVLAVNAEMARIFGCTSPEEAITDFTNLADQFYVDPEQRRQFITHLTAKGAVHHFEFEGRKMNGETLWISLNANLTKIGIINSQSESGEVVIDGFALDITDRKRAEEILRSSEVKFRSLAESSRDYIMRYDREGRHTYMNPSALAISGLTEADILGKTHRDCGFPEELCALSEEKIMQVFATGEPCQVEFSWNTVAGLTYLDWQLTPEHDAEDRVFSVLGVARDITERKQLENVQVFLAETSTGTEVEPFFYALARFLAENLRMDFVCIDRLKGDGLTAQTVAVWCDGHFEDNASYALKDTPCGEVVDQQICCYPASVCRLFPNDPVLQELRAESYAGVTLLNHSGRPIGLIAIISRQPLRDRRLAENTLKMVAVRAAGEMERLDAEQALRASEKLLRDIAANVPGVLYKLVRHQDGSFSMPFMSEGAPQLLGQSREVLQDASRLFSNIHPDDMPGVVSSISKSAQAMSKWRHEFRVLFPTGEIHWLQGTSQPSRMDDGGICWNGVILDVTERKKAEGERKSLQLQLQQAQKLEAIGTLAGGIAHDFNNILGVMIGFTDMVLDDVPQGSRIGADLEKVLRAGYRGKDLVGQILAFSRQSQDEAMPLQLRSIIKEVLKMLRSSLPSTIKIKQKLDADCGLVDADPSQIHQILMNLCTNAYHAMEENGGVLTIEFRPALHLPVGLDDQVQQTGGRFLELIIRDTGVGIANDIIDLIFDPFFTTKAKGKGTGMGLSIAYGIVKKYNGTISVESVVGSGTAFHIYLPESNREVVELAAAEESSLVGKEHILLIDDEQLLVEMGKTMLERLGYTVEGLTDSRVALAVFSASPDDFDLVITDQTMPDMTGLELAGAMLRLRPSLPIILCTGYSSRVNEEVAKKNGIRSLLYKPIAKGNIAQAIREIFVDC